LVIKGSTTTTDISLCIEGTGTGGNCDGKIDAGTVDPPYTINGKKYATYMASMVGMKEETAGTLDLRVKNEELRVYENVIDFNNQVSPSDLWLFSKTTNLRNNIDKMNVLLTPSDNTRTWYKIDKDNFRLTIYASRPTRISYRLTAPRFDHENWSNARPDDASGGYVINDPDRPVALNQNGNVDTYDGIPYAEIIKTGGSDVYDGNLQSQTYSVRLQTGEIIGEVVAYAEIYAGKLYSGLIQASDVIINNTLIAKNIVSDTVKTVNGSIDNLIVKTFVANEKITSPVIETKDISATGTAELNTVAVNEIKPQEKDLTVNLDTRSDPTDKGPLAKLIIKGLAGKTAAIFDADGNATFSGTLAAKEATISGTLAAANASVSGTLVAGNVQAKNITNLENQVSSLSGNLANLDQNSNIQNLSSNINDIQKLLADIKNNPLPNPQYYQNLDSGSSTLDSSNISNFESLTSNNLTVTGQSNLYNVSIGGSLLVGSTLIENNSIVSLGQELKLSALSQITLFNGSVVVAKDGTITTQGTLIAQGGIRTNEIQPINENADVSVLLGSTESKNSKLKIENSLGNEVASVDASGSAYFKQLALDKYMDATQSGAVIAAADNFNKNGVYAPAIETQAQTAGVAILPSNQQEVLIYNDSVKNNSLVYLTPTTPNSPQLTVSQKIIGSKPYFVVTVNSTVHPDIQFNWLIIN
jgi:hypothetical protein